MYLLRSHTPMCNHGCVLDIYLQFGQDGAGEEGEDDDDEADVLEDWGDEYDDEE